MCISRALTVCRGYIGEFSYKRSCNNLIQKWQGNIGRVGAGREWVGVRCPPWPEPYDAICVQVSVSRLLDDLGRRPVGMVHRWVPELP